MKSRLFPHRCKNCGNSYLCADKDRVFCTSRCECNFRIKGRENKILKLSEEEIKNKQLSSLKKLNERNKMERQPTPKKENKYVDLKSIMYKDTYKPWLPKSLRVMRG